MGALALDAPSATTRLLITASRIARLPACLAGASPDASRALSLPKTVLQDALASRLLSLTHAWMSWSEFWQASDLFWARIPSCLVMEFFSRVSLDLASNFVL